MNNAREFIEMAYPRPIRVTFGATIKTAYDVIQQLFNDTEFLAWELAEKNNRSSLINTAVEFLIKKRIDSGVLINHCRVKPNTRRSHLHIEIEGPNSILTVSRTKSKNTLPRHAKFRQNHAFSNQMMFDIVSDIIEIKDQKKYIMITHGLNESGEVFIQIGMPDPNTQKWVDSIDITSEMNGIEMNEPAAQTDIEDLGIQIKSYLRKKEEGNGTGE